MKIKKPVTATVALPKPNWFTEECLADIHSTFIQLLEADRDVSEELSIFRGCWDKGAMQTAAKRLTPEQKEKMLKLIKQLDANKGI